MADLVLNPKVQKAIIRDRRTRGLDRFDEVWNGIYVMSPIATNEHQFVAGKIYLALDQAVASILGAIAFTAINVTDRDIDWRKNYRCPDAAVFLPGCLAKDMGSHRLGGPDFAVEVISTGDQSRKKLVFYAKVGVRELLLVDRKPWSLELYRLTDGELKLVGKTAPDPSRSLASQVMPVSFRLLPGDHRSTIEVIQAEDARRWLI